MRGVVREERAHELAEAEIEEQRAAVCTRPRTHFRYLHIREQPNEFVHGKILAQQEETPSEHARRGTRATALCLPLYHRRRHIS